MKTSLDDIHEFNKGRDHTFHRLRQKFQPEEEKIDYVELERQREKDKFEKLKRKFRREYHLEDS